MAVVVLSATAASPTPAAPVAAIATCQGGPAASWPVTKGRLRVRRIRASSLRSAIWLKAPAAAEAIVTASPNAHTCQVDSDRPDATASPVIAVNPITRPIRSLNSSKIRRRFRARAGRNRTDV